MNLSAPFIRRPVATTLLTVGIALSGAVAFRFLPVSPLPQVDFPTISVSAGLPGASPATMASSVATPLERQFGRIAGVTEMTSSSTLGNSSITLQFDLNRDINAAARDVQAAINAARGYLPANLPSNPTYRKVNPADAPIFIIALTSKVLDTGQMYDAASTVMAQKLSQVGGVGQVLVGGSALPAVRVELNPRALNKYGIGLEQLRTVLATANANTPKGFLSDGMRMWEAGATDQLFQPGDYRNLVASYRNGAAVRISDLGEVLQSVEDVRTAGYANGKRSVLVIIFREPGANIIETVDRVRAAMPQLAATIPRAIDMHVAMDQTVTIRASVEEVERTLLISVALVVLVVFLFLRSPRATLIPAVAVPVSLAGAFAGMYLLGYSIDNLSLMALTISTGFVVDDAIVVIENITRYIERGMRPMDAALKGASEIGFTVFSISLSLVAVFLPLLLMGGIVGRLFREFAVTLALAVLVSMAVSLTTTPMMCAWLLRPGEKHGRLYQAAEDGFQWMVFRYGDALGKALRHSFLTLLILVGTVALNVYLFTRVPKGFFPQQDTGRLNGTIQADQDTSFQAMDGVLRKMVDVVSSDPAVNSVIGFTGGAGGANAARMFVSLKPLKDRDTTAPFIIERLRPRLAQIPGATLYLQPSQDVRVGGRVSQAQFEYTLRGDNLDDLTQAAPRVLKQLRGLSLLTDVSSNQQNLGLQALVQYDRETAARFGISSQLIDDTLYDAFGQRPVSTMYRTLNQYHVIMEAAPVFWRDPETLRDIYVRSPSGGQVPLNAFSQWAPATTPLAVNHQGLFPAVTMFFNLKPGVALGDAVRATNQATASLGLPPSIQTAFSGTAEAFQKSLETEPMLIAAALAAVYLVLGILYESVIHPITILSTLPSAGVGALLALLATRTELSLVAMIGIILLIGIVKKNAIMMIDFALVAEREQGLNSRDAIHEASVLRFRPILMTTAAALLGALPLALFTGTGAELRRPLGITIIGGLLVSQVLTLFTTPVVYFYFDRLKNFGSWLYGKLRFAMLLCLMFTLGCTVGPRYSKPGVPVPAAYKEPPPEGWKEAQPADGVLKGKWWEMYQDPRLNALVEQVSVSNQNVLAAEANYREAVAAVKVARSALFPVVGASASVNAARAGAVNANNTFVGNVVAGSGVRTNYSLPVNVSWEPDLFGAVRRSVAASRETAQATQAELENVKLLFQSELAGDFFQLRAVDSEQDLLTRTAASYRDFLALTRSRFAAGVDSDLDVAQAETQLYNVEAQLTDLSPQRAALEHAIAVLSGKPPAALAIPPAVVNAPIPKVPVGVPSALLERRPDIASAERTVAAANERIGIARAAYYPALSLTGSGGFSGSRITTLFNLPALFWTVGASLSETIFDAGRRRGLTEEADAAYDAQVAAYRQTVLTAFQQVEDNLAALRYYQAEAVELQRTIAAAQRALDISTAQYKAGTVSYLDVITSQTSLLTAQRSAVQLQGRRLVANVLLIQALGGGWDVSQLR